MSSIRTSRSPRMSRMMFLSSDALYKCFAMASHYVSRHPCMPWLLSLQVLPPRFRSSSLVTSCSRPSSTSCSKSGSVKTSKSSKSLGLEPVCQEGQSFQHLLASYDALDHSEPRHTSSSLSTSLAIGICLALGCQGYDKSTTSRQSSIANFNWLYILYCILKYSKNIYGKNFEI